MSIKMTSVFSDFFPSMIPFTFVAKASFVLVNGVIIDDLVCKKDTGEVDFSSETKTVGTKPFVGNSMFSILYNARIFEPTYHRDLGIEGLISLLAIAVIFFST